MPPWGAVSGFGEFRNETALTQTELEVIAQWVDGGAPEGDARDLPPAPPGPPRRTGMRGPLRPLDGDHTLARTITLEGLAPEVVPQGASMRITAMLPGGAVAPLVWLYRYDT